MADENIAAFMRVAEERLGKYWPGDRPGALQLLRFVEAVHLSQTPDEGLLLWVATAFEKILAGEDLGEALELKRGRGAPRRSQEWMRDLILALELEQRLTTDPHVDRAIEALAGRYDINEETVRQVYRKHVLPVRRAQGEGSK